MTGGMSKGWEDRCVTDPGEGLRVESVRLHFTWYRRAFPVFLRGRQAVLMAFGEKRVKGKP